MLRGLLFLPGLLITVQVMSFVSVKITRRDEIRNHYE